MSQDKKMMQSCRFYEQKYPKEGDLVMVEVVKVEDKQCYVELLEYNRIEALISANDMSKLMQENINKALRIGKQEVAMVLKVDEQKGYIDLSKKQLRNSLENACLERYMMGRDVNSILLTVCESAKNVALDELYTKIVWPLSKSFGHAQIAFRLALQDESILSECDISDNLKKNLLGVIKRRLAVQPVRIKADFELRCQQYSGVEAIKDALRAGLKKSRGVCEVRFEIIASPVYAGIIITQDKPAGMQVLKEALKAVEEAICLNGGTYHLRSEPKVYGDKVFDNLDVLQEIDLDDIGTDDEDEEDDCDYDDEESNSNMEHDQVGNQQD